MKASPDKYFSGYGRRPLINGQVRTGDIVKVPNTTELYKVEFLNDDGWLRAHRLDSEHLWQYFDQKTEPLYLIERPITSRYRHKLSLGPDGQLSKANPHGYSFETFRRFQSLIAAGVTERNGVSLANVELEIRCGGPKAGYVVIIRAYPEQWWAASQS